MGFFGYKELGKQYEGGVEEGEDEEEEEEEESIYIQSSSIPIRRACYTPLALISTN